jgi:very-short-patch-repair endonuclease
MEYAEIRVRLASVIEAYAARSAEAHAATAEFLSDYAADLCESEIEKVFCVAWMLKLEEYKIHGSGHGGRADYWHCTPDRDSCSLDPLPFSDPIRQLDLLNTQMRILDYRVDFALRRFVRNDSRGPVDATPKIVIECDGHDFHERTKEQASRDKERDRLLQTAGYVVLRFTGSEIWRNPEKCVQQVDDLMEEHLARLCRERNARLSNGLD